MMVSLDVHRLGLTEGFRGRYHTFTWRSKITIILGENQVLFEVVEKITGITLRVCNRYFTPEHSIAYREGWIEGMLDGIKLVY